MSKTARRPRQPAAHAPAPAVTAHPVPRYRLPSELALGCLLVLFFALRAFALLPHPADEGIYFYGALRWSQGLWPYRDFFFAHPPLHLLPNAALFKLFGFSLGVAKMLTFLSASFVGVAAYAVTIRLAPTTNRTIRQVAALMAATAVLFAESLLKAASTDTGICQASACVALAAVLLCWSRPMAAGAAAAAAPLTLLQAGPAAAVVVAASLLLGKRTASRCFAAAVGVFASVHAVFWVIGGRAFWQQVYGFHLDKVGAEGEGLAQLGFVVFDNWTLFVLAATGALALAWGDRKARVLAALAAAAAALTLVAMATRPRVFPFYFQPAFFPLSLLVGWGFAQLLDRAALWWAGRRQRWQPTLALGVPVMFLALVAGPLANTLAAAVSPRRAEQLRTYAQTYSWVDAPGLGAVNALIKALFWQDGVRVVNEDANAITQYLWQRSRWLNTAPAMVDAVRAQAAHLSQPSLFGDSTVAPLVALQAGLPVTSDLVDTNLQRIRTGNLQLSEVVSMLDTSPQALLLLGQSGGIGTLPELRAYVAAHYTLVNNFISAHGYQYGLWRRR